MLTGGDPDRAGGIRSTAGPAVAARGLLPSDAVDRVPPAWIDGLDRKLRPYLPDPPGPVAVAVSGGPDSLLLAVVAAAWGRRFRRRVHALTVDHGLRPESAAEARTVAADLTAAGIPCDRLSWSAPKSGHAAARSARYRLLGDGAEAVGASQLLTAHHADDLRETVAMRLARGSDLPGLAGMPECRDLRAGIRLVRPLLRDDRTTLVEAGRRLGLRPIHDPSNESAAYARTRWRRLLADPAAGGLGAGPVPLLDRLAATAGDFRASVERQAVDFIDNSVRFAWWGGAVVDLPAVRNLTPWVFREATVRLFAAVGGRPVRASALAGRMPDALAEGAGFVLAGCRAVVFRGELWIFGEAGRQGARPTVAPIPGDPEGAVQVAGRYRVAGAAGLDVPDAWGWLGPGRRPPALGGRIPDAAMAALPCFGRERRHPMPPGETRETVSGNQTSLIKFDPTVHSRLDRSVFAVVSKGAAITL